jgi:RNA polymerase sigma-B factor
VTRRNAAARTAVDEEQLFRAYAQTRDRRLRNEIVEEYMGLAAHIAQRFKRVGSDDDIRQSAMIGLVKAVERFDPDYGVSFATFAGSTIEGELKRHLRDQTWMVRVPRAGKELHLLIRRATDELTQANGRSPTVAELATYLTISTDDVLRGLAATAAYDVTSIDVPTEAGKTSTDRSAALASEEQGYAHAVDSQVVAQLLTRLPKREREIVRLRFFENLPQAEIAEAVGVSQMHVSRLLRRSLELMRAHASAADEVL